MPKAEPDSEAAPEPPAAALLPATTGGVLDAFVSPNHGHVSANAMTGNVVLLGVMASTHHRDQTLRHIVPIGAFPAGVITSRALHSAFGRRSGRFGLVLEIGGLAVASVLPARVPDMAFTRRLLCGLLPDHQLSSCGWLVL